MKRYLLILAVLLAWTVNSYAVSKEAQHVYEGETYFEKAGASGGVATGNPGYMVLNAPDYGGAEFTYYLWVNGGGKVCVASYPTISAYSSFPSGNWNRKDTLQSGNGMGCTVVGGQS